MTVSTDSTAGGSAGGVEKPEDTVSVTIDGISVDVPKDTLVIRAAEQVGVEIPRFCDHPLLAPVGACRQCLVEVPDAGNGRGIPKPQASCTLPVADGMVVNTQVTSAVADKAQQGIMEFLLINHPLDCPVCDKGGECPLQNQAMSHGRGETRFEGVKRTFPKPINISAQVLLDRERCVLCARCTRFSEQIAGDPFIALIERGALQQVGIYEKEPFESYFSGNTIQICPVGALTSAEYRFRSRPFDLVSSPAIAEHDACGSAIRVDHRRGKVMRRLAGNDPEVNEEWITDKDRFAFAYARQPDRLTHPLVRDPASGQLRAASWPEAFTVAARGLRASGAAGVLTGGRVTGEDAYAYAKFARVALGTNDIDFRARPHSAEEAAFLAAEVVLRQSVSYADLERATTVVLAGLEPEDEAGAIFLRLRKGHQANGVRVVSVAPYTSRGLSKLGGRLVPTAPGDEPAALRALADERDDSGAATLGDGSVVLVGERLATVPGALSAAVDLARSTGARLAWVPRRAGDRGAVEAGCLPTLLPGGRPVADPAARVDAATAWGVGSLPDTPGRDGDAILAAAASGEIGGLVIGGVDLDDLADPAAARAAVEAAGFVVSLELRATEVTRLADVVFPVAPVSDKAGMFVNWEGRVRSFDAVFSNPGSLPDLRVLAGIADELGTPLGFRTPHQVRAEMEEFGPWDGERVNLPASPAPAPRKVLKTKLTLATWKQMLDNGSLQDGDQQLRATARRPVARIPQATHDMLKGSAEVTLTGDRGSVTLPVEVADLPEGVVWVPANSFGKGVLADLSSPGGMVSVKGER
ncbi:NADH-quinone oxidoreductase subunit G [Nocardioides sp.]|uniref:NADH-quinone oxidoreductase subunit G n=1 Tax=Nocardioides sp. TaxID=35761 RepID=UPI0027347B93|nr:NADH-quinone oxidoreductase subunit G [Nocardioides sp.]MDP3893940.1 NADH-quinone oxidoreductase subunit G [Nocardioides sp.]